MINPYVKTGPFTNDAPPAVSKAFLDSVETAIDTVVTEARRLAGSGTSIDLLKRVKAGTYTHLGGDEAFLSTMNWMVGYVGGGIYFDGTNWQVPGSANGNGWSCIGFHIDGTTIVYSDTSAGTAARTYTKAQFLAKRVSSLSNAPSSLAQEGATNGQAIVWNNTLAKYAPADVAPAWKPDPAVWTITVDSTATPTVVTATATGDFTTDYSLGNRVKMTATAQTTRYGIIVSSAYATGTTTIKFLCDGTPTVGPTWAILSSSMRFPPGFSASPATWTAVTAATADSTQTNPVNGTWYNPGPTSLTIPIGLWIVTYQVCLRTSDASNTGQAHVTLSTGAATESDTALTAHLHLQASAATTIDLRNTVYRQKPDALSLAAKTTYYLNCKAAAGNMDSIGYYGTTGHPTSIRAQCVYF